MRRHSDWSHLEKYRGLKHPALIYVLRGFLPPTRENLLLSYKPSLFFSELAKVSGYKQHALQQSFYRARSQGLLTADAIPRVTAKGKRKVQPFIAQKLSNNARLMLIYDIPVHKESERRALKRLLHRLDFELVQQSVWVSDLDHRESIRSAVEALKIEGCVQLYESVLVKV